MRFSDILVDVAAVVSASRLVASKHVALRAQQLDRYGKTSSSVASLRQQERENASDSKPGEGAAAAPTEPPASGQSQPEAPNEATIAKEEKEAVAPEAGQAPKESEFLSLRIGNRMPRRQVGRDHTALNQTTASGGNISFVPAPWADNSLGSIRPSFPPRIPQEPLPRSHGMPSGKDFENAPPGINLDIFQTRSASRILHSLQEKEVAESHAAASLTNSQTVKAVDAEVLNALAARNEHVMPGDQEQAHQAPEDVVDGSPIKGEHTLPITPTSGTSSTPPTLHAAEVEAHAPSPDLSGQARSNNGIDPDGERITQAGLDAVSEPVRDVTSAYQLRESKIPATRISRIWNYSGLAVGMFAGAIGEGLSRAVGGGGQGSMMLSAGNMERLVAKLSRMRGAALKMGQMLSFQDTKMLPAPLQEVLQRVQDRADYMPAWQRDKVLSSTLGSEWRELFDEFDDKPIAAASIGQVHRATLKSNGAKVAVKIQFPGVSDSINSDLDNLSILLTATSLLPKGLYLNKTIDNVRTELGWECDYTREAECAQRYRKLLADDTDVFTVPKIYPEGCGKHVLTMEYMEGVGVTRIKSFTQEQRDWIGTQILRLCLREITLFKFMQTDPNWSNFQYNAATNKLELLDFGASREYPDRFIDLYVRLLDAASESNRIAVKELSEELGYLTGHESKAMLDAHLASILTLAEPFMKSAPEVYDFRDQTITERVKEQIPVMLRERLAPPPEETYSLHRKLSGAFLLCARLGSRVRCRELFEHAMNDMGLRKLGSLKEE